MKQLSISVIIPLYNKADYVVSAVLSVLAGECLPFEILVIDDGSTDDGVDRVRGIGNDLVRVIQQKNGGVSSARNRGIDEARGDLVTFLDADDLWNPDFLTRIGSLREGFPNCVLYATGYYLLYADGSQQPHRIKGLSASAGPSEVCNFYELRARATLFCTCSVAIPRELLNQNNFRFPLGEGLGEDQEVWFRVSELGSIAFDPSPAVAYRQAVGGSLSQVSLGTEPLPFMRRLAERYRNGLIPPQHRKGVQSILARERLGRVERLCLNGDIASAWRLLFDASNIHAGIYAMRVALSLLLRSIAGVNSRSGS